MTRMCLCIVAVFVAAGCMTKVDLAAGRADDQVSVFKSMSPGLTRVDDIVVKPKFLDSGTEVRMVPGEHDLHLELDTAATQNSWATHSQWNLRFATLSGHTYSAQASNMSGLFVSKSWLTIRDDTNGVEMSVEK